MDLMQKNVGKTDRMLRIALGVLLIALTLFNVIGAWGWIGIVPLVTGLLNTCPIYTLLGKNTCGR